jgi:hypothetical protein
VRLFGAERKQQRTSELVEQGAAVQPFRNCCQRPWRSTSIGRKFAL